MSSEIKDLPLLGHWFDYPKQVVRSATVKAALAIFLPFVPHWVGSVILSVAGSPIPSFALEKLDFWFALIIALGWSAVIATTIPRAYTYWQSFCVTEEGILQKTFGVKRPLPWRDIKHVEERARTVFQDFRARQEGTLSVCGETRTFKIVDKLNRFSDLKAAILRCALEKGIPIG